MISPIDSGYAHIFKTWAWSGYCVVLKSSSFYLYKALRHITNMASGISAVFIYHRFLLRTSFSWGSYTLIILQISPIFLVCTLILRIPCNLMIFNYYLSIDGFQFLKKSLSLYCPRALNFEMQMIERQQELSSYSLFNPITVSVIIFEFSIC